jgi:hypothetical protein
MNLTPGLTQSMMHRGCRCVEGRHLVIVSPKSAADKINGFVRRVQYAARRNSDKDRKMKPAEAFNDVYHFYHCARVFHRELPKEVHPVEITN